MLSIGPVVHVTSIAFGGSGRHSVRRLIDVEHIALKSTHPINEMGIFLPTSHAEKTSMNNVHSRCI